MSELDRRRFLKLFGQGAAVASIAKVGFPGRSWARSQGSPSSDEWEFYKPGVYDAKDAEVLKQFQAKLDQINHSGKVNISDVVSGKLTNQTAPVVSWNPHENNFKVTLDDMMTQAHNYVSNNPLFTDREYAKKTAHGGLIAFPLILTLEVMPAMPKSQGIGDYMLVSSHNDALNYYKPIYEGDTLFTIYEEQHCRDITPASGSRYRTFAMSGSAKTYNQKGELVAEGANILKESFRRHKDPAKRNPDGAHAWESPDWWQRKPHMYTDKDWESIIALWKNEKIRGATPLYWDDVKIGDEPIPTAVGPVVTDEEIDMLFSVPQWSIDTKKSVLDPSTLAKMVKNKQGIYILPEHLQKKPATGPFAGAGKDTRLVKTAEIANRDGRAVLQNSVCAKFAAGMLYNWMGDAGWLQRIGWDIMARIPGYDESVIPSIRKEMMPALFDKFPYMEKVPSMKDKRPGWHALEGDLIISRAYVTGKYESKGEHFVDLTWWCHTFDDYVIEEGFATVKLPKRA